MSARYFALLTNIGVAKIANAAALGIKLNITELAVGDGGGTLPTPTPDQTALINERRRAPINQLSIDPLNDAQIIVEQVIPENVGGWWIKEVGLFDEDGDLVAVSNCPETYKPLLQEGSGRTQIVRMVIIVSNTSSVTVKIDPAVVLATREYVDRAVQKNLDIIIENNTALASYFGFGMIGQCPDIQSLRLLEPIQKNKVINRILLASYHTGENRGGGEFYYDSNDMKSLDDGGSVIVTASGRRWKRMAGPLNATHFGARGDGTDETEIIQQLFDAAARRKLIAVIDNELTVDCHGLVLDERHSCIKIEGNGWIRFHGDGSTQKNKPNNIVSGADYCMYMSNVDNSEISLRIDGNSSVKIDNEQIHSIGVFGGKNINFQKLKFRNTRGDGLYVTQSKGNIESLPPENINIDFVESINDTFDGRNAVSIISAIGVNCTTMVSINHGGLVGGAYQPGGLDIEPNYIFQKCYNIKFKSLFIRSGGSQGLTIAGKQTPGDFADFCVKNVQFENVDIELTDTGRNRGDVILINGVNDVFVKGFSRTTALYTGDYVGIHVVGATGVDANITTRRCKHAAWLGYSPTLGLRNMYSSRFIINADRYHDGVSLGWSDGVTVDFIGINPTQMGSGDMGLLQFIANPGESTPIRRTTVKVSDAGYEGFIERQDYGVRVSQAQTPTIYKGTVRLIDSDLTNVIHAPASGKNRLLGTKDIIKSNVVGVTPYPGSPISGTDIWGDGDIVFDLNVSASNIVGRVYTSSGWKAFSQLPNQLS